MASNRNVLKRYAPQARLDFIQAVTNRAAQFGITKDGNAAGEVQGDLFILNGKAFPRSVAKQRGRLISRIARDGFAQTMEAAAYTWFNRFLAIRYMEVQEYLDHGCRVLSNPNGHAEPEILEKATSVDLPGLNRDEIVNLKLDGTKDEQIYRKLLIAQCNDLHRAMPFLFEKIDDETELLLPENLLQSDSIVRKLVNEIAEDEWQEIEIIGWLYQFYISEKKDQVIGKVVKSEDIPAATQLFTPNWIVKYMVQNSLGAQWLATYPDSGIRANYSMDYYIAPADQTPEVQAKIDAITPRQLDPEAITLIDPAVGSGHILVEAYDLFRAIYLERGYTKREAARAILTKNLFGLDIDDRAAQMAEFALLMKACADDRTVLRNPPKLNVLALQDSEGLDADALAKALLPQERSEMRPSEDLLPETLSQLTLSAQQSTSTSAEAKAIKALLKVFNGAKTFGSLITVPNAVMQGLPMLDALLAKPLAGDLYHRQAQEDAQEVLKPLIEQARVLGARYDCVVANPPYMGRKYQSVQIKTFLKEKYRNSQNDLFAAFIEMFGILTKPQGFLSVMSPNVWMYLPTFENFRTYMLDAYNISSLVQLHISGFDGATVHICTFSMRRAAVENANTTFVSLADAVGPARQGPALLSIISRLDPQKVHIRALSSFRKIPGSPVVFWAGKQTIENFTTMLPLSRHGESGPGLQTSNNERFLRQWYEVSFKTIKFGCTQLSDTASGIEKWYPHKKGGPFRKWAGNSDYVVNWQSNGRDIKNFFDSNPEKQGGGRIVNSHLYFRTGICWTHTSSGKFSARTLDDGFIFNVESPSFFPESNEKFLSLMCSNSFLHYMSFLNPTLHFSSSVVTSAPCPMDDWNGWKKAEVIARDAKKLSDEDWNSYEISWNFSTLTILDFNSASLCFAYESSRERWLHSCSQIKKAEEENNRLFIEAYGLEEELTPDVPLSEITLTCNPHYRYSGDLTDDEREEKLKSDTMRELVSYAVGCMMGRYSLVEPGLIYAHSGGLGFDPARYGSFPADDDGIIPMSEEQWFADDVATRIEEFLGVAWPEAPIMETMATLMDGLTMGKASEPRAALRSYLSKQFYKDHLQTYKNRPIYWLFSSGKQKAFEALVYLHRYNEGTLARMRTIYVTPLMGKLQQRISDLDAEIAASSSSAEKTRKNREKDKLAKQVVELREFDEELRHLADQRIPLDLDDGVKVNYARFGNLLAAKDKVCPKKKDGDK